CGEAGVGLSLMKTNGAAANGTLAGTLGISLSGLTQFTVNDLAYDIAGDRKLKAESASYSTPTNASETITFTPNRETVASYQIAQAPTVFAGTAFPHTIKALDNAGGTVVGADNDINNNVSFTWFVPGNAPDGTPPDLPQPVFVNGIATPTLTFY